MESKAIKIYHKQNNKIALKVIPGHFATTHSHINFYIDMTSLKIRQNEAADLAKEMAADYQAHTIIDTIVCMDGCEVVGAFLAEELTKAGIMSVNLHKTLYIVSPEPSSNQQLLFRDNVQLAIRNKHVLLLLASATTGVTIKRALECITYYGGEIAGISAIFSAVDKVYDHKVNATFTPDDVPTYATYKTNDCPFCKASQKVDAMVNSFGYSKL